MTSRRSGWPLSFRTIFTFLFTISVCIDIGQALLIDGPFKVKVASDGYGHGNCDAHKQVLNNAFQEAVSMARDAIAAIDKVGTGRGNWIEFTKEKQISAILQVHFNVLTGSLFKKMTDEDGLRIAKIKSVYERIIAFSQKDDQGVSLYCSDEWLEWTKDPDTGEYYWYSPDHKIYLKVDNPSPDRYCGTYTGAVTLSYAALKSITWCPPAFTQFPPKDDEPGDPHKYRLSLLDIKHDQSKVKDSGKYIHELDSIPGQFLHEITHLLGHVDGQRIIDYKAVDNKGQQIDHPAYEWYFCYWLAKFKKDQAVNNADNYHQFALAMYIGDVDWTTGYADAKNPNIVAAFTPPPAQHPCGDYVGGRVGPTPKYPVVTEQPFKDEYFYADMNQAKIASSMISAMIKTEVEKAPKAFQTEARPMSAPSVEEKVVLAEL